MRRNAGFTLIELMIVVALVGILATVAIPAYNEYVQRSNRSAAQQFMLDVANRAEQYRLDASAYPDGFAADGGDLDVAIPADIDGLYSVELDADNGATPPNYEVTATPKAGSSQAGGSTLTLDSTGNKTPADEW